MRTSTFFSQIGKQASKYSGRPFAINLAIAIVLIWLLTGPVFKFSDTWQLVINTGTSVITFLMVFLIQSSQNRDTAAIQVKLDEIIRATKGAHNSLLDTEELDDKDIEKVQVGYSKLASAARDPSDATQDLNTPEVEVESRVKVSQAQSKPDDA